MVVVLLSVPQAAPVHPVPDRVQVTPTLLVFCTVAVNDGVFPARTVVGAGVTETVTGGGWLFTVEAAPPPHPARNRRIRPRRSA